MQQNNLPPGFISIDEAVELIKSDTRDEPVVDMDYLIMKTVWIETNHNFRIPKIKKLPAKEVYRSKRGNIIEFEHTGDVYVMINTNYEKEFLKKTIFDKYRELVGHEYIEAGVRSISTVADDAQGRAAVQPRKTKNPIAKEGAIISGGEEIMSNGEGVSV